MKLALNNLNEALTYHLEGMYDGEKKLQKALPHLFSYATSSVLKSEIKKYLNSVKDKRLKLKRVFSYLLAGPFGRKNKVIDKILKDGSKILECTRANELRDALLIGHLQGLVHYKISSYGIAKDFASRLDLQNVTDLLQEVLEWEKETDKMLTKIATKEVNKKAIGSAVTIEK